MKSTGFNKKHLFGFIDFWQLLSTFAFEPTPQKNTHIEILDKPRKFLSQDEHWSQQQNTVYYSHLPCGWDILFRTASFIHKIDGVPL